MNNESCKACRFWKCVPRVDAFNNKLTDRYGECRISRPKMGGICDDKWPSTTESDWCGEYQAAEQQSAPKCSQCGESLCANGFLRRNNPFIFAMPCNCCGFENRLREADLEKFCTCKHHNSEPLCYYCKVRTNGII